MRAKRRLNIVVFGVILVLMAAIAQMKLLSGKVLQIACKIILM
jgi:hypothetical protein